MSPSKARETFLYLLMFVSLAITAMAVGGAYFNVIDAYIQDPLDYAGPYRFESLRWQLSAIIVASPVFLFVTRAVRRLVAREPDLRRSGIRKWITYLALFIAAAVILGDLINVLAKFFGGELTPRFIWKSITVLMVSGLVFGYYFLEMRQDDPVTSSV
ncbi:hypothetical protein HYZ80_02735 [Candidatus Parcubacteria bacterium]|nr:hypothetical protein [Candidatus Parcubacteria bacterium]